MLLTFRRAEGKCKRSTVKRHPENVIIARTHLNCNSIEGQEQASIDYAKGRR